MEHKRPDLEISKKPKEKPISLHPLKVNDALGIMLNTPPLKKKEFSLFSSDDYWGQLPFTEKELHGKRISFEIVVQWEKIESAAPTYGTGEILIRKSKKGLHVEIVSRESLKSEKIINLTADMAKMIKKGSENPNCEFSLKFPR